MDLKVSHKSVLSQTVATLRNAIMSGELSPGERLVEAELCGRTGVSRTSIRESLRRLEAERLISFEPNRGPSVAVITWADAADIYAARALLEGEATALFAESASAEEVERLAAALNDFERSISLKSSTGLISATTEFYQVILSGCGNKTLGELLEGLLARVNFLRSRSMSLTGRENSSALELRAIYNAIKSNEPEVARAAAIAHVESACEAARLYYAQQDAVSESAG